MILPEIMKNTEANRFGRQGCIHPQGTQSATSIKDISPELAI